MDSIVGVKVFPGSNSHVHKEARLQTALLTKLRLRAHGLPEDPLLEQLRTVQTRNVTKKQTDPINIPQRVCRPGED